VPTGGIDRCVLCAVSAGTGVAAESGATATQPPAPTAAAAAAQIMQHASVLSDPSTRLAAHNPDTGVFVPPPGHDDHDQKSGLTEIYPCLAVLRPAPLTIGVSAASGLDFPTFLRAGPLNYVTEQVPQAPAAAAEAEGQGATAKDKAVAASKSIKAGASGLASKAGASGLASKASGLFGKKSG
jgi:hypothetical protein